MVSTNNNYIMVDNKPVTIKEYDGQRVVTFKDIDALHNRPKIRLRNALWTTRNTLLKAKTISEL